METVIREKAYAKLNLTLDVLGKREDGYHEMLMVMQTVSLFDDITIALTGGTGKITLCTNRAYLPNDEKNLGFMAAQVFFDYTGRHDLDAEIKIQKRIPVCAGMGGGSSDAAAVLRGLNDALGRRVQVAELEKLSEKLGSDVPFCVNGGTTIAKGTGTELTPLPEMPECDIVIVKPRFSVSTPKLFGAIDSVKLKMHPDTDGLLQALADRDIDRISRRCYNVFEDVLPKRESCIVQETKARLISAGACGASMTGTGSAVFGIFTDFGLAKAACTALKEEYPECFLAKPVPALYR